MTAAKRGRIQQQLSQPGGSLEKYISTVIGEKSIKSLLFYELIMMLAAPFPGLLGNTLRKVLFPTLFGSIGKSCFFGQNLIIQRPYQIYLGNDVGLANNITLSLKKDGRKIIIKDNVKIGERSIVNCLGGILEIGQKTVIGNSCRLGSYEGLLIGEKCLIGDNCYVSGAAHSFNRTDIPIIEQALTSKGVIRIGNNVVIGRNVTILTGVQIGSNVQIFDNSLVNSDVVDNVCVNGVPAKKC